MPIVFFALQSLIIQLGVKECIVVETNETKTARGLTKKRKSIAIDLDADDQDDIMDVDPPSSTKVAKGKGKDDQDFVKLFGMIERCGVVITEVQTGTSSTKPVCSRCAPINNCERNAHRHVQCDDSRIGCQTPASPFRVNGCHA